jgi:hypothetical protein
MKSNVVVTYLLVLMVAAAACSPGSTSAPTQQAATTAPTLPPADTPLSPTPPPTESARPRIEVEGDTFLIGESGQAFVPRGVNHIEITSYGDCALATGQYSPEATRDRFGRLADAGYNTVRMFLDTCSDPSHGIGRAEGGLNPKFLDNIVDLMHAARSNGIHLLLTSNDLPENGGYWTLSDEGFVEGTFGPYRNTHYLTEGGVRSAVTYWRDLMSGLAERQAPFDAMLGWQLLNEQWFFNNDPPFSLESGRVTTANGHSYDMANLDQKRAMANDAIIYWMEQVSAVIHEYDPEGLITMGFFDSGDTLAHPDWDFRYNDVAAMLERAPLDFIDFHAYPGGGANITESAEAIGLVGYEQKPVILGEFGAFRQAYPTPEIGAQVMAAWMEDACRAGFDGWLYWIYGQVEAGAPDDPWGFVEGDGIIMDTLAPLTSPDPCDLSPVPVEQINLAYGADVTASLTEETELDEYIPERAVDFSLASWWTAPAGAPQWFEIELDQPSTIERIVLIDQFAGVGRHVSNVYGSGPGVEGRLLLATLEAQNEQDEMTIDYSLPEPIAGIQTVRVETTVAPGWVIWHEVQLYGSPSE